MRLGRAKKMQGKKATLFAWGGTFLGIAAGAVCWKVTGNVTLAITVTAIVSVTSGYLAGMTDSGSAAKSPK